MFDAKKSQYISKKQMFGMHNQELGQNAKANN